VQQPADRASQQLANTASCPGARLPAAPAASGTRVVSVPVLSLRPADSPRLNGEDKAHIARLAETETPLPPILVDARTMRVIDGMHRLMAASIQGRETIDVTFFDGSEADVFLRAVQENVAHGLPLSQADRRAAAERIIASHPHMSDRAIGHSVGLAAKTVAGIRKSSSEEIPQSNARVGRDGRIRPLDSGIGRRRAAELLTQQPTASLRDIARAAGISPATVLDVRKRLERGESPVPGKLAASTAAKDTADNRAQPEAATDQPPAPAIRISSRATAPPDPAAAVEKLLRDPSLRNNDRGKGMLRLLHVNAVGAEQLPTAAAAVPPHCVAIVVQLARQYAMMWHDFASELDGRARIIDPSAAARLTTTHPTPPPIVHPGPPTCQSGDSHALCGGHDDRGHQQSLIGQPPAAQPGQR
jgi:ParB-like chromosome segregation protein Spo0J